MFSFVFILSKKQQELWVSLLPSSQTFNKQNTSVISERSQGSENIIEKNTKKKKWNPSLVQPSRRNQYRCWNSDKQRMTLQLDQSSVGSVADVDTLGIYASDMACDALQYKNHNIFSNAKPDMHSVASSNAEG